MPTLDAGLFDAFDRQRFPDALRRLIAAAPLPSLASGPRCETLSAALATPAECLQQVSPAGLAGLWLLAGELDASHAISQRIEDSNGSFWHAIMHRREGDFANAKYWFRRVGRHRVLAALATTAYGDPLRFVDACERAMSETPPTGKTPPDGEASRGSLEQLQWLEWQQLFTHCLAETTD